MKTSSLKAKGRALQYFVCERIAEIFDSYFEQEDDHCPIHSREMGQHGKDIVLRGEIHQKFKFDVECKNVERLELYNSIKQAKQNTDINRDWLLVHKKNQSKPIVVMSWEAFENLVKKTIY